MNPSLEFFLTNAFTSVQPTSDQIGHVVVEPDYDISPADKDAGPLAAELTRYLHEQPVDPHRAASPEGYAIDIPSRYQLLSKYLRKITLFREPLAGSWVAVEPPGNWI